MDARLIGLGGLQGNFKVPLHSNNLISVGQGPSVPQRGGIGVVWIFTLICTVFLSSLSPTLGRFETV